MNIGRLQGLKIQAISLDELVAARADMKTLASNYDDIGEEIPDWVTSKLSEVEHEIKSQTAAARAAKLQKLKSRRDALSSREEKKSSLDAEIAALEAKIK